ncbi:hypothetical protein O6P43_004667 [Quillaja saponaria]|uniref:Uncharacterized protein n=1 Tax=Quillaja saponaria TaxID=32244 RepID=A0AAD7Q4K2_QUISA|nr:hypothetical protein O6P43_004667 [Quillaja saponaria]
MAEDNDDNNGLSKTPEKGEMATLKCEDDSKTILQNDEQIEKPKEFLDVISEGAEVANSGENPENTTCMNREEITSISGEILENKKENTIEEVSKGSQKEASKSAAEKQVLENTVGELSSDLLGEETGKEDSKEENCDEVKVTLTNSEIKEQSKETKLMEEKECEALEVRTQPKQDLDALTNNPHRKEIDKNLFVESCFASETLDKETEDEIHGEEDSTIDDSANEHVVVLNGERGLNKFKPEAAPDKNDISITHLEAKAGLAQCRR